MRQHLAYFAFITLMICGLLLATAAAQPSAAAGATTAFSLSSVTDPMLKIAGAGLAVLANLALVAGLSWFKKKTGISLSTQQRDVVDRIVKEGIGFAEEAARKKLRSAIVVPGEEKLGVARSYATKHLGKLGIDMHDAELDERIHALLQITRKPTMRLAEGSGELELRKPDRVVPEK